MYDVVVIFDLKAETITQSTLIERLKADNLRIKQQVTDGQQRTLQEKALLARHLEAIEADMMEREAAFAQMQNQRESMAQLLEDEQERMKQSHEVTLFCSAVHIE